MCLGVTALVWEQLYGSVAWHNRKKEGSQADCKSYLSSYFTINAYWFHRYIISFKFDNTQKMPAGSSGGIKWSADLNEDVINLNTTCYVNLNNEPTGKGPFSAASLSHWWYVSLIVRRLYYICTFAVLLPCMFWDWLEASWSMCINYAPYCALLTN